MKSSYDLYGNEDRKYQVLRNVEFSTVEEYDEAVKHIEALLLENHKTMQRVEYLADEIETKRVGLNEWQESLDKEQELFTAEHAQFKKQQRDVLAMQERINLAINRVNAANKDPIEMIDEILLLLELEEKPEVIIKHLRDKREVLDVKW